MVNFFSAIFAAIMSFFSILGAFFPAGFIKITVGPTVFECGNDYYSVVWETSTRGSGYVKYTYNGEEKIVWDSPSGVIATDDTVHVVLVPKKELQGNKYKVGSQYVAIKNGYNAIKGLSTESDEIQFNGIPKEDDIKILAISDIHGMEKDMHKSLKYFTDKPDMVALLGDISSTLENKNQYVKNILKNASDLSKGEIPVVYARGNHETRGEFGAQVIDYFPTETGEFYYTFQFGSLSAIVLDSGEDKEDDHEEYSGLVDFATHREKEYKWLTSLEKSEFEDSRYKLVLSHHPVLNNHFGKDWATPLKNLGMDLMVGGHYHKSDFIEGDLPIFFVCGKNNYVDGCWAASMVTLKNDTIHMLTIDNNGNTLLDKTI